MMPAAAGWGERHNMRTLISITTGVRFPGLLLPKNLNMEELGSIPRRPYNLSII